MRAPAFVFLSSLLMADVWAAPQRPRITDEPSSTGLSKGIAPRNEGFAALGKVVTVVGGITLLSLGVQKWRSRKGGRVQTAVVLEAPAAGEPPAAAPPPPPELSSLGRLGPADIDTSRDVDQELQKLARPNPDLLEPIMAYEFTAAKQKHKVVTRMVKDERFLQCMLRRLNIPLPQSHQEIPVRDLDLFRSAFLCQIETGDFGFKFPHVKHYLPGRADEPVGYREEDLAKAAESMHFHVPAPLARMYSGFTKDLRSLERPLGRAVLSWERAAPKRMMPTAAESWRFASEHP
ncbi:MAG: hypothetical protein M1826_002794 [Phylliscum demangeonii]|nr:MAG: hypothetical protein M1826_002794 [Phylliscum demangeonii]